MGFWRSMGRTSAKLSDGSCSWVRVFLDGANLIFPDIRPGHYKVEAIPKDPAEFNMFGEFSTTQSKWPDSVYGGEHLNVRLESAMSLLSLREIRREISPVEFIADVWNRANFNITYALLVELDVSFVSTTMWESEIRPPV